MTRIVRAAKVLLAALIATLAVWLGLIQSAAAAPAPPMPAATFGYDGHHHAAVPTYTTTERGPPLAYGRDTAHFAVDDWSHGALARPSAATTGPTTTYTTAAKFVQGARATGTTQARVQGDAGALSVFAPPEVAANAGARLQIQVGTKIEKQMGKRGWTRESVEDLIQNPTRTVSTRDTRHLPGGGRNDAPATAYINRTGGYVVRNDETGDIVQVSNLNDPNWKSPW